MIVYFGLFAVLIIFSLFRKPVRGGGKIYSRDDSYLFVTWLLISIVEGVRAFSIGTDTHDYVDSFVALDYKYESYEILSRYLVDAVHIFTDNATVYLLVAALITNGLIIVAIKRISEDKCYSIFLYITLMFYFTSYNVLRQAVSYAIIVLAITYLQENKPVKYWVLQIIAIGFHNSAVISVIYFVAWLVYSRDTTIAEENNSEEGSQNYNLLTNILICLITIAVSMFVYLYFDKILLYLAKFFPMYEVYLYNQFRDMAGGFQQALVYSAILICFLFFVPNTAKYKRFYLIPLITSVILSFASMKMAYIVRFMYYFDITTVIAIPYMLKNNIFSESSQKVLCISISLVCIAFMLYGLLGDYMRVRDYVFIWNS